MSDPNAEMSDDEAYAFMREIIDRTRARVDRPYAPERMSVLTDELWLLVKLAEKGLDVPNMLRQIRVGLRATLLPSLPLPKTESESE